MRHACSRRRLQAAAGSGAHGAAIALPASLASHLPWRRCGGLRAGGERGAGAGTGRQGRQRAGQTPERACCSAAQVQMRAMRKRLGPAAKRFWLGASLDAATAALAAARAAPAATHDRNHMILLETVSSLLLLTLTITVHSGGESAAQVLTGSVARPRRGLRPPRTGRLRTRESNIDIQPECTKHAGQFKVRAQRLQSGCVSKCRGSAAAVTAAQRTALGHGARPPAIAHCVLGWSCAPPCDHQAAPPPPLASLPGNVGGPGGRCPAPSAARGGF